MKVWLISIMFQIKENIKAPSIDGKLLPRKVWDEVTYPFPNCNYCTVEV